MQNETGLRILNLETHQVRVLTNTTDNRSYWSPDGSRILFTRERDNNFDLYTIKPDGTDLRRMTDWVRAQREVGMLLQSYFSLKCLNSIC